MIDSTTYGQYAVLSATVKTLSDNYSRLAISISNLQTKLGCGSSLNCCDLLGTTTIGNTTTTNINLDQSQLRFLSNNQGITSLEGTTNTESRTIQLPNNNGILTLSVSFNNGSPILSDAYGNINLGIIDVGDLYTAGIGIDITNKVVTNTSPNQIISLTGTGSTTISGTYPNFTINSTGNTYSAGTGLNLVGTVFNNTSPDQIVSITGSGASVVTGTYPNFTINSPIAPTYTTGSVLFAGSDGLPTQDNVNFLWDDISNRLSIGVRTVTPDAMLTLQGGDFRVHSASGTSFILGGGFYVTDTDGLGAGSVQIIRPVNAGFARYIKIDQPNMQMIFQNGNADGTAGILKYAPSFGGNYGELRFFSNDTGTAVPGSITFFTGGVQRLKINQGGNLTIGVYTLPQTDGTSGQTLQTDGAGTVAWQTVSGGGGGGGTTTNALTVNNSGTGGASPFSFDGSAGKTISYNSIGAASVSRIISTTSPLLGGGDLSSNRTFSILQSNTSTDGYISHTDWNIFNNKQSTIILTTTGTSGAATLIGNTLNIPQYSASGGGTTTNLLTFNNSGAGDVSGTTFNGSIAKTVSYNSIGAQALLISGTNIKTLNGITILGSGDIPLSGSGTVGTGAINRLAYYNATGTAITNLAAITANKVLISNSTGLPIASSVSNTTLAFLDATSSVQTQINLKISNVTGFISSGSNITITGVGTIASPYIINTSGSTGTVNTGTINTLAYYAGTGTVITTLPAITANRVLLSNSNGLPVASSVTNTTLTFLDPTSSIQTQLNSKQATLVSATNIKTINGSTILGSGNLVVTSSSIDYSFHPLTDGATITLNYLTGINFTVTLGGNRTMAFSGTIIGVPIFIRVTQDGTGNRTLNFPANTIIPIGQGTGTVLNLTTSAGAIDLINIIYDGTNYLVMAGLNFVH